MTTLTYWHKQERQRRAIETAETGELRAALVRLAELEWKVVHDNRRHLTHEAKVERSRRDFLGFLFSPWKWGETATDYN